jgi:hypothetical protein
LTISAEPLALLLLRVVSTVMPVLGPVLGVGPEILAALIIAPLAPCVATRRPGNAPLITTPELALATIVYVFVGTPSFVAKLNPGPVLLLMWSLSRM